MQPSKLFVAFVGPFYELSLVPPEHFSEPSPILPGPFSELLLVPLGLFNLSLFLPGVSSEFSHVLPWLPSGCFLSVLPKTAVELSPVSAVFN